MSTLAKDLGRGCLRSAVIQVVSVIIGIPLSFCLIGLIVFSVDRLYDQPLLLALLVGMLILFIMVVPVAVLLLVYALRKREMDSLFVPLGLQGSAYSIYFRQYHGQINGRKVDVYFQRGPLMQIEVGTHIATRLGVSGQQGDTRALAGLLGQHALQFANAPDLLVFSPDPEWAGRLLTEPAAAELLRRLVRLGDVFTRHSVVLRPGTFQLLLSGNRNLFNFDLEPAQAAEWVNGLLALAAIAERLPAPLRREQLNQVENLALSVRQRNPFLGLWIALGMIAVLICLAGVTTVILISLNGA